MPGWEFHARFLGDDPPPCRLPEYAWLAGGYVGGVLRVACSGLTREESMRKAEAMAKEWEARRKEGGDG